MLVEIFGPDFVSARAWLRRAHPGIDLRIEGRIVATRIDSRGRRHPVRQYRVFGTTNTLPIVPCPASLTPVYTARE